VIRLDRSFPSPLSLFPPFPHSRLLESPSLFSSSFSFFLSALGVGPRSVLCNTRIHGPFLFFFPFFCLFDFRVNCVTPTFFFPLSRPISPEEIVKANFFLPLFPLLFLSSSLPQRLLRHLSPLFPIFSCLLREGPGGVKAFLSPSPLLFFPRERPPSLAAGQRALFFFSPLTSNSPIFRCTAWMSVFSSPSLRQWNFSPFYGFLPQLCIGRR